jgi:hypothetical protein
VQLPVGPQFKDWRWSGVNEYSGVSATQPTRRRALTWPVHAAYADADGSSPVSCCEAIIS